jgi:hypothetical protein
MVRPGLPIWMLFRKLWAAQEKQREQQSRGQQQEVHGSEVAG